MPPFFKRSYDISIVSRKKSFKGSWSWSFKESWSWSFKESWRPGFLPSLSERSRRIPVLWRTGSVLRAVSKCTRYAKFQVTPRGLKDIFNYWVCAILKEDCRSKFETMLGLSLILGHIAFWEMAPSFILEVSPMSILDPTKIKLIYDTLVSRVCEAHNLGLGCMCTEDSIHTSLANKFEESLISVTEEERRRNNAKALGMVVTSLIICIVLNAAGTYPISTGD